MQTLTLTPTSTPCPSSNPTLLPPLLRLPVELHLHIAAQDDRCHLRLQITNRYFREILPRPSHEMLLRLEGTERFFAYACKHCLRLRPSSTFAENSTRRKMSFKGSNCHKRFCADCGFASGPDRFERYTPGNNVIVAGVQWTWCRGCKELKKGDGIAMNANDWCQQCYNIQWPPRVVA
jgi:hypothetical protein